MNYFLFESKNIYRRKNFFKDYNNLQLFNLQYLQKNDYVFFLQQNIFIEKRQLIGLEKLFNDIFPLKLNYSINNIDSDISLYYKNYNLGIHTHSSFDSKIKGDTFSFPLILTLELCIQNTDSNISKLVSLSLGELPLLSKNNTFVINGIERIILSQLERTSVLSSILNKSNIDSIKLIPYKGA